MDYALIISLGLYFAYAVMAARSPRQDRRTLRIIIALLVAIAFYTVLKYVFIACGIQPR